MAFPGVSRDMIRMVIRELQGRKEVECLGRGRFGGKEVISLKEGNKEGNVTKWRAVDKII